MDSPPGSLASPDESIKKDETRKLLLKIKLGSDRFDKTEIEKFFNGKFGSNFDR